MQRVSDQTATRYSPTHEWIRVSGDAFRLGLSAFAAGEIGEVAHVQLPSPGDRLRPGELLGEVESVKSINEILAPVAGRVVRVNTRLYDDPQLLGREPEAAGWLVELDQVDAAALDGLLDAASYASRVAGDG